MEPASPPNGWPPRIRPLEYAGRMLRVAYNLLLKSSVQHDLYALIYGHPAVRHVRFMNYGHWPLPGGFLHDPAWAEESAQAGLYHRVLAEGAALLATPPRNLLEVACGRGGGARYAQALFPETRLTVLDAQPDAVLAAREVVAPARASVLVGSGAMLPFPEASFDMVISVEAMMNLGRHAFLAECARVLRKGGAVSVSGFQPCPGEELAPLLARDAAVSGLELHSCQDITPAVLEACRVDQQRREVALARGSRMGLSYMRNFAALPDTRTYRLFAEGKRCYFLARFTRPLK
jgi:SAM-dependent methyltransferase